MTEATQARQMLLAAERAAAASDFASAERLLQQAADLQERALGPEHPDLANTYNNLGVVCEYANRREEAEPFYRRAYAIATKAFPPDHPFVATSRKNLTELCELLGKPVDEIDEFASESEEDDDPLPADAVSVGSPSVEAAAVEPAVEPRMAPSSSTAHPFSEPTIELPADEPPLIEAPPPTPPFRLELDAATITPQRVSSAVPVQQRDETRSSRALSFGAVMVIAIAAATILIGWIAWPSRSDSEQAASQPASAPTAPAAAAPPSEPAAPADAPAAAPTTRAPEPASDAPPAPPSDPRTPAPRTTAKAAPSSAGTSLDISDARLCRSLSTRGEWRCDPIGGTVQAGTISFYTRIASPRATKIQHRWYQGETLRQNVTLSIQPNAKGYRTFSRLTVGADRAGQWRVELRSEDGRVLREERFTVGK